MKARYWLVSAVWALATASVQAAPADLSVYVFKQGQPVPGVEVSLGDQSLGATGSDGAVRAGIDPGEYRLELSRAGEILHQRSLRLVDDEVIQMIVTLFPDQRPVFVDIETSDPEKGRAVADQAGPDTTAGPPGQIRGRVTDVENGRAIEGARVFVSGVADEVVTGEDGAFSFELPPGEYSLSVLAPGFNTRTVDGLPVNQEQVTERSFELTPEGTELPEFVVTEPYISGSLASVVAERREDRGIKNILSAEEFKKTGDGDAAAALKRVPGLSLVGGEFVFVRGLGERYSSTRINGMPVPSPDPTRKVIPLDIFPTGVIESISVKKTLSAEMPGDFGGGTVNLRTNGIPEEGFFSIGTSFTYNTQTTLQSALTSKGSPTDFLGFDDGSRNLPDSFDVIADQRLSRGSVLNPDGLTPEQTEQLSEDLGRDWSIDRFNPPPDIDFTIAGGDSYSLGNAWRWGFTSSLDYEIEWDTRQEIRRQFTVSQGDELQIQFDNVLTVTEESVDTSAFVTTEVARQDRTHWFSFTSLLVRESLFDNRISEGFNARDGINVRQGRIRWNENEAFINQLLGHHEFNLAGGLKFDWGASLNSSEFEEPNRRSFRFDELRPGEFSFSRARNSNLIRITRLDENTEYLEGSTRLDLTLLDWLQVGIYGGADYLDRKRDSQLRRFQLAPRGPDAADADVLLMPLDEIFTPEFIGANGFLLREGTLSTDSYTASQELFTYHFGSDWRIGDFLRIDAALKVEDNDQSVTSFEAFVANPRMVTAELIKTDYLPLVSATVSPFTEHQFKAAFSESVNRPQFREFAEAPFNDPNIDADVLGNVDLVQADLTNYDLRWDWFFSESEFVSLAGFYKTIDNPIELVRIPTDSANLASLLNADDGELLGGELEFRVNLNRLWDPLQHFYLRGNFTIIDSEVSLTEQQAGGSQTDDTRRLQGQSDEIMNLILGYDNPDRGLDATLAFNDEGARVSTAGISGIPNTFETAPRVVDFLIRKNWGTVTMKLEVSNILDESTVFTTGGRVERKFETGREIELGVDFEY